MEEYRTVSHAGEGEYSEKRSRFISAAVPVSNEQEALDFIAERKSKFWDARHNVYAYSLREGNCRRYSEDGEPQGTAGVPTLDLLTRRGVADVCVVTTRYFGGVLLGTGGLVRAYSHAAQAALDAAGIVTMRPVIDCELLCEYFQYGRLEALVSSFDTLDRQADFSGTVTLSFSVRREELEALVKAVADATSGQVRVMQKGTRCVAVQE